MRILGIVLLVAGLTNMGCVGFNLLTDMRYVDFDTVSKASLSTRLFVSEMATIVLLGLGSLVLIARYEHGMGRGGAGDSELKQIRADVNQKEMKDRFTKTKKL